MANYVCIRQRITLRIAMPGFVSHPRHALVPATTMCLDTSKLSLARGRLLECVDNEPRSHMGDITDAHTQRRLVFATLRCTTHAA